MEETTPKRRRPPELEQTTKYEPTDDHLYDDLKEASKTYEDTEKELIEFVEKQVKLMNENLLFAGREPSFYELNRSLADYESVAIGLTSLYAMVRIDKDLAQEKYDDFYASKFVEERTLIAGNLGQGKVPSTRELDMIVRTKWMKELSKLKADQIKAETKRSLVERLTRNWDAYQWCLSTLSKNAISEADASKVSRDREEDRD